MFLGERLTRTALVGVALAIAGVVFLGVGSTAGSSRTVSFALGHRNDTEEL